MCIRDSIHNVAVVVTRYFGGTLLGTGGLVRAYQKAAQEGLSYSVIVTKQNGRLLTIKTDYTGIGKIQYILCLLYTSPVLFYACGMQR